MPPAAPARKPSLAILPVVGPWYTRQSWLEAQIDLRTPFGIDGAVKIRDAVRERVRDVDAHAEGPDAEAYLFRAYVVSGPGMPGAAADIEAWKKWVGKQRQQVVQRMARGINRFRYELYAEDADYAADAAARAPAPAEAAADGEEAGPAGEANPND